MASLAQRRISARRSLTRGVAESSSSQPLVLPDLTSLTSLRPPHRAAEVGEEGVLGEEWRAAAHGKPQPKHQPAPGAPTGGAVPVAIVSAKKVREAISRVDLGGAAGRDFLVDIVRRYETRIEALEEELRLGCVRSLRADLLEDEVVAQRDLHKRQCKAISALQKRLLVQGGEEGGRPTGGREREGVSPAILREQQAAAQKAIELLENANKMLAKEKDDLKARLDSRTSDYVKVKTQMAEQAEELAKAEGVAMELEKDRQKLEANVAQLQVQQADMEARSSKRVEELQAVKAQLEEDIAKQKNKYEEEAIAAKAKFEQELAERVAAIEEQRKALELENEQLKHELSISNAERDRAEQRAVEAEEKAALVEGFKDSVEVHLGIVDGVLATLASGGLIQPYEGRPAPLSPAAASSKPKTEPCTSMTPGSVTSDKSPKSPPPSKKTFRKGGKKKKMDDSLQEQDPLELSLSAQKMVQGFLGARTLRREMDGLARRLEGAKGGLEGLMGAVGILEERLADMTKQYEGAKREAELRQDMFDALVVETDAERKRLEAEAAAAESRCKRMANRLEQLEVDNPLIREQREREEELRRRALEVERNMHVSPSLPDGFKMFLARMERNRLAAEERVRQKREGLVDQRTKNLKDALEIAAERDGLSSDPMARGVIAAASAGTVGRLHAIMEAARTGGAGGADEDGTGNGLLLDGRATLLSSGVKTAPQSPSAFDAPSSPLSVKRQLANTLRDVRKRDGWSAQQVVDSALAAAAESLACPPRDLAPPVEAWLRQHGPERPRPVSPPPTGTSEAQPAAGFTATTSALQQLLRTAVPPTPAPAGPAEPEPANKAPSPLSTRAAQPVRISAAARSVINRQRSAQHADKSREQDQKDLVSQLIGPPVSSASARTRAVTFLSKR